MKNIVQNLTETLKKFDRREILLPELTKEFCQFFEVLNAEAQKVSAEKKYDASLILDAYLLRSLAVAGYAPSLSACSRCDAPGPHKFFSLQGGGSVCPSCKPSASAAPAAATLELMANLLTGNWGIS